MMWSAIKKVSSLFIVLLFISACNLRKDAEALIDSDTYFIVDEGGGFAGSYVQFRINQNGRVEQFNFKDYNYKEIAMVSPADVDGFFNKIEELELGELELSSPGNMSRYIEINYMGINDHKLIWAMESSSINPDVVAFFTESFTFCKKLIE